MNITTTNHSRITYKPDGRDVVTQELEMAPPGVDVADGQSQIDFVEEKLGLSYRRAWKDDLRYAWDLYVNVRANSWTLAVFRPVDVERASSMIAAFGLK